MSKIIAKTFSEINFKRFKKLIKNNGYVVIRGLFKEKEIREHLKILRKNFKAKKDNPSNSGSHREIMKNYQKICVGSSSKIKLIEKDKIYRFHRIIYNPIWSPDIYYLRTIFKRFCGLRNQFLNYSYDYATRKVEGKIWSATRILQYPKGGGHMSCHKDFVVNKVNKKNKIKFYQFILNMSQLGKDFKKGGAYIKKNNQIIYLEKFLKSGDILVYNGTSNHGVYEIDPDHKIEMSKLNGRVILMNSFYQTKINKN